MTLGPVPFDVQLRFDRKPRGDMPAVDLKTREKWLGLVKPHAIATSITGISVWDRSADARRIRSSR